MSAEPAERLGVRSQLIAEHVPDRPAGVVLVLHGGGSRGAEMAVSPTQLSVLRMIPIAKRIAHVGHGRLAVFRLLNSARGWDARTTPVDDVRWALAEVADRLGMLPASLVGHSLGGRAALLAGDAPEVRSVVALAPWVYPSDAVGGLADRQVLIVHGDQDRVAKLDNAATVARRLAPTARVGFVRVAGGKHAMLRRHSVFDGLAAEFALATLLGSAAPGAGGSGDSAPGAGVSGGSARGVVAAVLAGERWLEV